MGTKKIQDAPEVNEGFDAAPLTAEKKQEAVKLQLEREEAEKERERIEQENKENLTALKIQEATTGIGTDEGFQAVDTGNFSFEELTVGSVFIGQFIEEWTSEDDGGNDKVTGLLFLDAQNRRKILPKWYQLYNFFVNKESRTPIDWNKKALFKIMVTGCEEAKKGKVYSLDIAVKYLS